MLTRETVSPLVSELRQCPSSKPLLKGLDDEHEGVIIDMMNETPTDPAVFVSLLRASLSHWTQEGKKGIWMKLPIELVNLVEPAIKEGFYFHHAEPKYLMLVHWIPETTNILPANASHRVGIAAFVMNDNKEVLVVQEKNGILRGTGVWKFPTGVVDGGEDICDAAVREVKEETGIEAKFVEVLAFGQTHKSFFEKSDLIVVCLLKPLSFRIQVQELEIEAAQWMPFKEYAAQQFVQKNELLRCIGDICLAKRDGSYSGFSTLPTRSFSDSKGYLYLNRHSLSSL